MTLCSFDTITIPNFHKELYSTAERKVYIAVVDTVLNVIVKYHNERHNHTDKLVN